MAVDRRAKRGAVLLLLVCGCTASEAPPPPPVAESPSLETASPPSPADQAAARDAFVESGLRSPGSSESEIVARLGQPTSAERRAVPNRHDPAKTDTLVTLSYPGIEIHLHKPAGIRDLISEVAVTDDAWLADPGIRIGMRWEEMQRLLGPAEVGEDGAPRYDCGSCPGAENPVYVEVADGVVRRIRFTYYVD